VNDLNLRLVQKQAVAEFLDSAGVGVQQKVSLALSLAKRIGNGFFFLFEL
jgi:hypothetical protein